MNNEDELKELWKSQPASGIVKGNEMLEIVEKKMQKFDRMIAMRNRVECIAAAAVVIFFTWTAVRAPNVVMKAGSLVVAAGAAWIIFYMLRYGRAKMIADPSENLANYTQALVGRYDQQIRLLKSVKYWYLLPMYIGLVDPEFWDLYTMGESRGSSVGECNRAHDLYSSLRLPLVAERSPGRKTPAERARSAAVDHEPI